MLKTIALLLLVFGPLQKVRQDASYDLIVRVHNIKKIKGSIMYAVYDHDKNFLKEAFTYGEVYIVANTLEFKVDGLKEGVYAISIFHDENDNGQLDSNFIGIPSEPYGFSNNAKGMFGPPSFDDCRFELRHPTEMIIEL